MKISRMAHALLAPHIAPKSGAQPSAAAAILQFQESLIFAGWSAAQARAELHRLGSKPQTTKGNAK